MNTGDPKDQGYLDKIRRSEGTERCKAAFAEAARQNARHAAALLNDSLLSFPCLYLLRGQIMELDIQRYVSPRNVTALQIVAQIKISGASAASHLFSRRAPTYSTLKWMLETGSAEEFPANDYEETLDVAASVLINVYKEQTILPLVVDLIFRRSGTGRYIHDLVWALFKAHDPEALRLIAEHLRSSDVKEAELAAELLNLDDTDFPAVGGNRESRYARYRSWLEENKPYLYFTEESFQYASRPVFSALDLERKYLQAEASAYVKQTVSPANPEESQSLTAFQQLNASDQKTLSAYSKKVHDKSVPAWKEWLRAPASEQLRVAKAGLEHQK